MSLPRQCNVLWSLQSGLQPVQIIEPRLYLITDMRPNFEHCCRFCANFKNKNDMFNLELNSNTYTVYLEMLMFLKVDYVDLSPHSKLSRRICKTCSESLQNAYLFFKQVKTAQDTLISCYDNGLTVSVIRETVNITTNYIVRSQTDNVINALVSEHEKQNEMAQCNKMIEDDVKVKEETPEPEINGHLSLNSNIKTNFPLHLIDSLVKTNFEDNNLINAEEHITKTLSPLLSPDPLYNMEICQANSPTPVTNEETTDTIANNLSDFQTSIEIKEYECDTKEQAKDISEKEGQAEIESDVDETWDSKTTEKTKDISEKESSHEIESEVDELWNSRNKEKTKYISEKESTDEIEPGADKSWNSRTKEKTKDFSEKESKVEIESEVDESWDSYEWLCFYCNANFETMNDLRTHSKDAHAKCYGFKCVDCRDDFNTFNSFIEHVRRHKEYLRFFCEYCNHEFDSPSLCATHTLTHWSGSQRACEYCGEQLPNQNALERHRRAYKKKGIAKHSTRKGIVMVRGFVDADEDDVKSWSDYEWTCRDCGARMPDVASLRLHSQEVHKKCFAMKCVDCLLLKRCFKSFVSHVRMHRPVFNLSCEYCNAHCSDINEYKNHIQTHETPVPPCGGCGQIFPTRPDLLQHIITYNACIKTSTLTRDDLTCETCHIYCKTMSRLKTHMMIHSKNREKQYTCDVCGASFYTNSSFRAHKESHECKHFECTVCKLTFKCNLHLTRHIRTHREGKPFICDHCGKSFKSKFRIKRHLIVHTDIKPFRCLVCGKGFRFKNCLKVHIPQHTGFKNFACEYCNVKFYNWSNCNKHMIRRHGVTLAKNKRTPTGNVAITDRRVSKPDKSVRKRK